MDLPDLTLEFKALHEKAKKSPLGAEEEERWRELKRRLGATVANEPNPPRRTAERNG